jgi:membrane protease YdiL (CAAX protease family)
MVTRAAMSGTEVSPSVADLPAIEPMPLPLDPLAAVGWIEALAVHPLFKGLLPFPLLVALSVPIWWIFRKWWKEMDRESALERMRLVSVGASDYRPAVCLMLMGAVLTFHEYYGGRSLYEAVLRGELQALEDAGLRWLKVAKYDLLYGYTWWSMSRVVGYVLVPVVVWKLMFRQDSLWDYGLHLKGTWKHAWIYAGLMALVGPVVVFVAQQPDFGNYYPFYKLSSRSWFDLLAWELMYFAQFFALEFFFRGWMIGALRGAMGSGAIFAMALPYCMIHYGKPYLEAHGAIIAGVVLGSLSMRTRSIYGGFFLHIGVAALMDFLSLYKRGALPTVFWAPG